MGIAPTITLGIVRNIISIVNFHFGIFSLLTVINMKCKIVQKEYK